jgi:hypothetical protein
MKMVVDRFEGDFAVCENMETRDLIEYPISSLPEGVCPGDVLACEGDVITINHAETEERRKRFKKMFEDLCD